MNSFRRHRNWLKGVNISQPNRPGGTQGRGHRCSTNWCHSPGGIVPDEFDRGHQVTALVHFCSSAFPLHKWGITMAAQQDKGIPIVSRHYPTAPEPKPHGLPVTGPSGGPTPPPATSPLPMSSLPDIPLACTPLLGCPFADLLAIPSKGKQTTLSVIHLTIFMLRGSASPPQKLRLGVSTASHRAMTIHLI